MTATPMPHQASQGNRVYLADARTEAIAELATMTAAAAAIKAQFLVDSVGWGIPNSPTISFGHRQHVRQTARALIEQRSEAIAAKQAEIAAIDELLEAFDDFFNPAED